MYCIYNYNDLFYYIKFSLHAVKHVNMLFYMKYLLLQIGVHCAKFSNEKISSNVIAAVQRYNIHHPVVNDLDSCMWEALGIRCWPTLLILGD